MLSYLIEFHKAGETFEVRGNDLYIAKEYSAAKLKMQ
jgi:hypothetical protein